MKRYFLLILLSSISTCSYSNEKGNSLFLDHHGDIYTLFPYADLGKQSGYFGVFRNNFAATGGDLIYLFPDGDFVISEFCDICPEKTMVTGTYNIKDSKLALNYNGRQIEKYSNLHLRWGWINKGSSLTGRVIVLLSESQVTKLQKNEPVFDYIYQTTRYPEWRKVQGRLLSGEQF